MRLPKWIFTSEPVLNMLYPGHLFAAILLLVFPNATSAAGLAGRFTPGTSYYFDQFDPRTKPWEPGHYLNIEEVFKNYQYFEIVFDQGGKGITVIRYLRGSKVSSDRYHVMPDASLRKE